jgi:hypothetical protein
MAQGAQSFDAMRQDAIRRSREMQRRAVPPAGTPHPAHEPPMDKPPPKPETPGGEISGLLESLHLSGELHSLLHDWDGEKLALAGLLYLLWKEGTDPALLLALAYILL